MPVSLFYLYYTSIAFNLMLMGMILSFAANLRRRDAICFLLFLLVQVLWVGSLFLGYYFVLEVWRPEVSVIFVKLAYGFGLLMVFFLSFFFVYFPRLELRVARWLKFVVGALVFGMAGVAAGTDLVHATQVFVDGRYVADEFGFLYLAYMLVVVLMFVLGFVFSIMKLRVARGLARRKVLLSAMFAWIFLALAFSMNVLLPFFEIYLPIAWLAVASSLFFSVPTFFALRYYRFFGFSYLFCRFLLVGLLGFLFYFLELKVSFGVVLGVVLAFGVYFLRSFFESADLKKVKEAVLDLKLKVLFADNFGLLVSRLEDCFGRVLAYDNVKLLLASRGEVDRRIGDFGRQALIFEEIFYRDFEDEVKDFLTAELKRLGASFCLPLIVDETFLGVLVLGDSLDDKPFLIENVRQFEEFGRVLELAVANVLLRRREFGSEDLLKSVVRRRTKVLRDLISRQSDFLATTAHEFRTPLNIAMFQLEDAMKNYRDQEGLVEDMKSLASSLEILGDLTQRLFDFQRYDLEKVILQKEEVDFGKFVREVCQEFRPLMEKRKKDFGFRDCVFEERFVALDRGQMRQVLSNLFSNALKFAQKIEVVVEAVGNEVCVRVVDYGCGVADHLKARIFEKFQSGSGKLPDSYGLGMGLFIARKIVLMHGGRIEVSDTADGGATFSVYL